MNLNLKEHYTTPAAVIECDLRKEIFTLKMQMTAFEREIRLAHEILDTSEFKTPPGLLPGRLTRWMESWMVRLEEFKAEQKAVIDEWKAGKR